MQQPYLARYDAAKHKAIVLDEPSAELVGRCKVFLQAGLDGCELYQSATQRYTRWYCVFNVPLIICTNVLPLLWKGLATRPPGFRDTSETPPEVLHEWARCSACKQYPRLSGRRR